MASRASVHPAQGTVLLVGLGDLAIRIAARLVAEPAAERVMIAGRNARRGRSLAALLDASGGIPVAFVELDALNQAACETVFADVRPDVVVQAAVAVSPWRVAAVRHPRARRVVAAGFGVQLPFQLLCIRTVMKAARAAGCTSPVVNCSYPDVTNVVLAAEGLAPTVGIGNAGMVQAHVEATLRARGQPGVVRVVAQHGHTRPVLAKESMPADRGPWIFVGEDPTTPQHELAFAGEPIEWGIETNMLSAATAVPVIRALLPAGHETRTSVPGPFGLLGGYPVRVRPGGLELDLPAELPLEQALAHNRAAARLDGIGAVENGRVSWAPLLRERLSELDPALAEPVEAMTAVARAQRLATALALASPF